MYADLRSFLDALRANNELLEIDKEVDPRLEIGDITRKVNDFDGPALLFTNVKGHPGWKLASNVLGTLNRLSLAMEAPVNRMIPEYAERLARIDAYKPVVVLRDSAPCKEVVIRGPDVDLAKIPIPTWHAEDGGPFITVGIQISKDPDTGARNASMVRQMVLGRNKLGILFLPGKHTHIHYLKKQEDNQPLDIAVAIGVDPSIEIVGTHSGPIEEDEFAVAGALRGKVVEMVKCETVDLDVPASAELIIEGRLLPNERIVEGPFGEYTGWLAPQTKDNPPMQVTCITHRKNPIFQGLYEGKQPNEDSYLGALAFSASILAKARENCPGLVAYAKNPYGTGYMWGTAAIKKMYPGHAKHAMHAILGTHGGKYQKVLIIVDDTIDVHDMREVVWAISTRCRPERDVMIERDTPISVLDPAMWPKTGLGGRILIDATEKWEEEGNAPKNLRQTLINHELSPYWREINAKGLASYLGIDVASWMKKQ